MKKKNSILFFFAILSLVIQSCNNDKEIVEGLNNRILKINTLINSQNKGTYYLNILDDSINIIKFDISIAKIKEENKVIVSKLLDSISNNILIVRLTNCIIGKKYSLSSKNFSSEKYNKMKEKYGNVNEKNEINDMVLSEISKMGATNKTTVTIFVKNEVVCEIITSEFSGMSDLLAFGGFGLFGNGQKPAKSESGTYKYIGDNKFEISNGFILRVTDVQNCKAELSINIPTDKKVNSDLNKKETISTNKESDTKSEPSSPTSIKKVGDLIRIGNLEVALNDFSERMNWDEANEACSSLGRGWRLPSLSELKILYKNKNKIGSFNDNIYWASKYKNEVVWFNFRDGEANGYGPDGKGYVRAVRSL